MDQKQQYKVLLVEDDPGTVYSVKRCLEISEISIDLCIAENGQQGVDLCKATNFHLILMDIRLPVLDGISATKAIRALNAYKTIPIIAFTANSKEYPKEICTNSGMNDLISKPFDIDEFIEMLSGYLNQS